MVRDSDKKDKYAKAKIEDNNEIMLRAERAKLRRLFTVAANSFNDIHRSMSSEKNIDIQFSKRLNIEDPEDLALEKEKVLENLMTFLRHEVEKEHCILAENGCLKCLICGWRLCPDVRQENPTSKDEVNNVKKKTSCITSELTSEEIEKERLLSSA
ncbi:hypothetical protein TNCV_717431 [Trichonephila clavipes]|nr:hypothetical protein TNCV_717431 [Trichonephila clavipes]